MAHDLRLPGLAGRLLGLALLLALAAGGCVCGSEDGGGYPDPGPDYPGGSGGGAGGCTGSCGTDPSPCSFDADPRCTPAEACTVLQGTTCGAQESCIAPTSCAPVAGLVHGLYPCSADADCGTERCVAGSCLWVCATDADCPEQFACKPRELGGGLQVLGCVGIDATGLENLSITLCHADRECLAGKLCQIIAMPGNPQFTRGKLALCVDGPPAAPDSVGQECVLPGDCRSGLCALPCDTAAAGPRVCGGFRCSQPCAEAADCPSPYVCGGSIEGSGVGGRQVDYCTLPQDGCFDDADCCPDPPGCSAGWRAGGEVCRLVQQGTTMNQLCLAPGGLAGRFDGCARDSDCASGLCAGAMGCVSPCVPSTDRCDGTPGGGVCLPTPDGRSVGHCIAGDVCGDGFRTGAEACDGTDVGPALCGAPTGGQTVPWCSGGCELDNSPCGCSNDSACPHGPCDVSTSACGCWHSVGSAELADLGLCLAATDDELIVSPLPGVAQTGHEFCASLGIGGCRSTSDLACGVGSCDGPVTAPGMVLCGCTP